MPSLQECEVIRFFSKWPRLIVRTTRLDLFTGWLLIFFGSRASRWPLKLDALDDLEFCIDHYLSQKMSCSINANILAYYIFNINRQLIETFRLWFERGLIICARKDHSFMMWRSIYSHVFGYRIFLWRIEIIDWFARQCQGVRYINVFLCWIILFASKFSTNY